LADFQLSTVGQTCCRLGIAGGEARADRIALIISQYGFYVAHVSTISFDRRHDARERPGRPIDAGGIRAGTVSWIASVCCGGHRLMIPSVRCGDMGPVAGVHRLYDVAQG